MDVDEEKPQINPMAYAEGEEHVWVAIQLATFTNWVNQHLAKVDRKVENLATDLSNGLELCHLVQVLQDRKIGRICRTPKSRHHHFENVELALSALRQDNVPLINIGSGDIVDSNLKMIMGFIWALIQKYHMGKTSRMPPKKLMLTWLQSALPKAGLTNLTTDWNDGTLLLGLLDYCKPGLCPEWHTTEHHHKGLDNCSRGLRIAEQVFNIPPIISAENLNHPKLDELSSLTYLSYFMNVDSPGYQATMDWVNSKLPEDKKATDFTECWRDGKRLCELVHSIGGNVEGWPEIVTQGSPLERTQKALDAALFLGVNSILSPRDLIPKDIDHLTVMTYCASLKQWEVNNPPDKISPPVARKPPTPAPLATISTPPVELSSQPPVQEAVDDEVKMRESQSSMKDRIASFEIQASAIFASPPPIANQRFSDRSSWLNDVPTTAPPPPPIEEMPVPAEEDIMVSVHTGPREESAPPGHPSPKLRGDVSLVTQDCRVDDDVIISLTLKEPLHDKDIFVGGVTGPTTSPKAYTSWESDTNVELMFVPLEAGPHKIEMNTEGSTDDGLAVELTIPADPNDIHVEWIPTSPIAMDSSFQNLFSSPGEQKWSIGRPVQMTLDARKAGEGEVVVKAYSPSGRVRDVPVEHLGQCRCNVRLIADEPGPWTVEATHAGNAIPGSPFRFQVEDPMPPRPESPNQSFIFEAEPITTDAVDIGRRGNDDDGVDLWISGDCHAGEECTLVAEVGANADGEALSVTVTRDGWKDIPCQVATRLVSGRRMISFLPSQPGEYSVQTSLNGQPIAAPLTINIPERESTEMELWLTDDASLGEECCLQLKADDPDNVLVTIVRNDQDDVPCIVSSRDAKGLRNIIFTPERPGDYHVEVMKSDSSEAECSLTFNVPEKDSELELWITGETRVAQQCSINLSTGDDVDVDVTVTRDGVEAIPCILLPSSDQNRRQIVFSPMCPGDYVVQVNRRDDDTEARSMTINIPAFGSEEEISATKVDHVQREVMMPADFYVTGECLNGERIQANRPASFTVHGSNAADRDMKIRIYAPSGAVVPSRLHGDSGVFDVDFEPKEIGAHRVTMEYAGSPICGSPFTVEVFDSSKVKVDIERTLYVNTETYITVVATGAGNAPLNVEVVPVSERSFLGRRQSGDEIKLSPISYTATKETFAYTPTQPGDYDVNVTYGKQQVPGSPFRLTAVAIERKPAENEGDITTYGEGLVKATVDEEAEFVVDLKGRRGNLMVRAEGPSSVQRCDISGMPGDPSRLYVRYTPKEVGLYRIPIEFNGYPVRGSPFNVNVAAAHHVSEVVPRFDARKVHVEIERTVFAHTQTYIKVNTSEAGRAPLNVQVVRDSGQRQFRHEEDLRPVSSTETKHTFPYKPSEPGDYNVSVTFGGQHVRGSPFPLTAIAVAGTPAAYEGDVAAYGEGLVKATVGQEAEFVVDLKGRRGNLMVKAEGPTVVQRCDIISGVKGDSSLLNVRYRPIEVGVYRIPIEFNGTPVRGSPFDVSVVAPHKVRCLCDEGLFQGLSIDLSVGVTKVIRLDCRDAGPGTLRSTVYGPNTILVPSQTRLDDQEWHVIFTPVQSGEHKIELWWGEVELPNSPYQGHAVPTAVPGVLDHKLVFLSGRGIREARIKEEAVFLIDGRQAGPGKPGVSMSGSTATIDVTIVRLNNERYKCTYVPSQPGGYLLTILWGEYHVRGSPFKVSVLGSSDADRVVCKIDGLSGRILGESLMAKIDTTKAGPGQLLAHCEGMHKAALCEMVDHRDRHFSLTIRPQEAGRHVLQIKYNNDHVTGSPFIFNMEKEPRSGDIRVYGPGIEPGVLSTFRSDFICDTKGGGAGELAVRVKGPEGAFKVTVEKDPFEERSLRCHYDPTVPGDYIVTVKWSGKHAPGSPFRVPLANTQEELAESLRTLPVMNATPSKNCQWSHTI